MSFFDTTEAPASIELLPFHPPHLSGPFSNPAEADGLYLPPKTVHTPSCTTAGHFSPPQQSPSSPPSVGHGLAINSPTALANFAEFSDNGQLPPGQLQGPRRHRKLTDETSNASGASSVASSSDAKTPGTPAKNPANAGKGYVPSYLTEEPQDCKVCLDVATGYHYRVLTCEGCKGFFRRTVQKNLRYVCRWNADCVIDRNTRNNCQRCRFDKCLRVGMATDMVLDSKQRDQRARLIDDNRMKRQVEEEKRTAESKMPKITESDRSVITNLTTAYDEVLSRGRRLPKMFQNAEYHEQLVTKITELVICALLCKSDSVTPEDVSETRDLQPILFNVLVERLSPSASRVISFASCVPGFMSLHPDDQTVLLKDAMLEVLTLWNALGYNEATENLSLIFGTQVSAEWRDRDYPLLSVLEPILKFARGLKPFHLDKTETALLSALIILQADRPGLLLSDPIDALQSNVLFTFERYVRHQHLAERIRWPKLLMKVTDLRTVPAAYAERTLTIKLDTSQELARVFQTVFSDAQPPQPPLPPPAGPSASPFFPWGPLEAPPGPSPAPSLSSVLAAPAEVLELSGRPPPSSS